MHLPLTSTAKLWNNNVKNSGPADCWAALEQKWVTDKVLHHKESSDDHGTHGSTFSIQIQIKNSSFLMESLVLNNFGTCQAFKNNP